jgi:hypothetical protein
MISDGLKKCRVCQETFSVDHFYYNKSTKGYTSACKPCHIKRVKGWTKARESKELIRKAKRDKSSGLKICWSCKEASHITRFVEWDTRVYINEEYILGEEQICARCYDRLRKKAFKKIYGAIQYHNTQQLKRGGKRSRRKAPISV